MSDFKFNFWNEETEHYEYAETFEKAIRDCECVYGFKTQQWEEIKKTNDFHKLKEFLDCEGIEAEVMGEDAEKSVEQMDIGTLVEVIDENDMNFGATGKISKRESEWDIEVDGIKYEMVKVDFGGTINFKGREIPVKREVPYAKHQLKEK